VPRILHTPCFHLLQLGLHSTQRRKLVRSVSKNGGGSRQDLGPPARISRCLSRARFQVQTIDNTISSIVGRQGSNPALAACYVVGEMQRVKSLRQRMHALLVFSNVEHHSLRRKCQQRSRSIALLQPTGALPRNTCQPQGLSYIDFTMPCPRQRGQCMWSLLPGRLAATKVHIAAQQTQQEHVWPVRLPT
jgi:hypothetical protein